MADDIIDKFKQYYEDACRRQTDINFHLPKLYELAMHCHHVTEFGVRDGESSRAFLYAATRKIGPVLRSYDIDVSPIAKWLFEDAKTEGADVRYYKGNTLEVDIEPTEMLFIDTWHTAPHLRAELERHHIKVGKYLVFHDTHSHGLGRPDTENRGLLSAIIDFMIAHPKEWEFKYYTTENNGLTVLKRIFWYK